MKDFEIIGSAEQIRSLASAQRLSVAVTDAVRFEAFSILRGKMDVNAILPRVYSIRLE